MGLLQLGLCAISILCVIKGKDANKEVECIDGESLLPTPCFHCECINSQVICMKVLDCDPDNENGRPDDGLKFEISPVEGNNGQIESKRRLMELHLPKNMNSFLHSYRSKLLQPNWPYYSMKKEEFTFGGQNQFRRSSNKIVNPKVETTPDNILILPSESELNKNTVNTYEPLQEIRNKSKLGLFSNQEILRNDNREYVNSNEYYLQDRQKPIMLTPIHHPKLIITPGEYSSPNFDLRATHNIERMKPWTKPLPINDSAKMPKPVVSNKLLQLIKSNSKSGPIIKTQWNKLTPTYEGFSNQQPVFKKSIEENLLTGNDYQASLINQTSIPVTDTHKHVDIHLTNRDSQNFDDKLTIALTDLQMKGGNAKSLQESLTINGESGEHHLPQNLNDVIVIVLNNADISKPYENHNLPTIDALLSESGNQIIQQVQRPHIVEVKLPIKKLKDYVETSKRDQGNDVNEMVKLSLKNILPRYPENHYPQKRNISLPHFKSDQNKLLVFHPNALDLPSYQKIKLADHGYVIKPESLITSQNDIPTQIKNKYNKPLHSLWPKPGVDNIAIGYKEISQGMGPLLKKPAQYKYFNPSKSSITQSKTNEPKKSKNIISELEGQLRLHEPLSSRHNKFIINKILTLKSKVDDREPYDHNRSNKPEIHHFPFDSYRNKSVKLSQEPIYTIPYQTEPRPTKYIITDVNTFNEDTQDLYDSYQIKQNRSVSSEPNEFKLETCKDIISELERQLRPNELLSSPNNKLIIQKILHTLKSKDLEPGFQNPSGKTTIEPGNNQIHLIELPNKDTILAPHHIYDPIQIKSNKALSVERDEASNVNKIIKKITVIHPSNKDPKISPPWKFPLNETDTTDSLQINQLNNTDKGVNSEPNAS